MEKTWSDEAWEDYESWQGKKGDPKKLKKISELLKDIERNGNNGIGHPEALTGDLAGFWSRHIDDEHRLIYRIHEGKIEIMNCRTHYGDK